MDWRKKILELREQYYFMKYPHACKDHGMPRAKPYRDDSKKDLVRCILDFISFSGGTGSQTNNAGGYRKVNGKLRWVKMYSAKKVNYDILAIYHSREIHISLDSESIEQGSNFSICNVKIMDEFLTWWEENICNSGIIPNENNIQSPENDDKSPQLRMTM